MATTTPDFIERRLGSERRHGIPAATASAAAGAQRTLNAVDWIAFALLVVGGLNWGLYGLFGTDLVAALFGEMSPLARVVYVAVGLSALYSLYTASKMAQRH